MVTVSEVMILVSYSPIFFEGKKRLWNCLWQFVHPCFIHSSVLCLADAMTQQPLGPFTPTQVYWDHLCLKTYNIMIICSLGLSGAAHGLKYDRVLNSADALTQQLPDQFTPNQVYWDCFGLQMWNIVVRFPFGPSAAALGTTYRVLITLHHILFLVYKCDGIFILKWPMLRWYMFNCKYAAVFI